MRLTVSSRTKHAFLSYMCTQLFKFADKPNTLLSGRNEGGSNRRVNGQ